jgi:hypothetical protein
MATYKVIQDIEAEDKLVGPFSLRQFIYAGGAALMGYLSFISVAKGAPFLLVGFIPPMVFCAFFAWPWSPDQPTEVWALAKIRFFLKPRRRIWDQSGIRELVTITVPKKIEKIYTDGLSQMEVKSRLSALADTIDSRGWAVKNSSVNLSATPHFTLPTEADSDRLVGYGNLPQAVPDERIPDEADMLDERANPIAQQFDQMMNAAAQKHRSAIMQQLSDNPAPAARPAPKQQAQQPPNDYWFMNQPAPAASPVASDSVVFSNPTVVQPGVVTDNVQAAPTLDEKSLSEELKSRADQPDIANSHLKTIDPHGPKPPSRPDPVTTDLARNNDLDVATLARQAQKAREQKNDDGEVVIPLH